MNRVGEWRLIDSDEPDDEEPKPSAVESQPVHATGRRMLAVVSGVVVALAGAAIWLTLPQPAVQLDIRGAAIRIDGPTPGATTSAGAESVAIAEILVDVEGAVAQPGLHRLPADSRVGDAIAAAGGYSPQVDIATAAARLNLAEHLVDGAKVHVPMRGESATVDATTAPEAPSGAAGGLIDVNHASSGELDTLPGIGPVTADKIIAARTEAPFVTVDDLLSRGVIGPSTMEKIRERITVTP